MKVVIDASSTIIYGDRKALGGIGRTTLELIRALSSMVLPFELELFIQKFRSKQLQNHRFELKQHRLPLPRRREIDWLKKTIPLVESLTGADLFHIPHNWGAVNRPGKTIVTIHDAMFLTCREAHLHSDAEAERILSLGRQCAGIITCSQHSKADLVTAGGLEPDKITVIPWGYDHAVFHPQDNEEMRQKLALDFNLPRPYLFGVSCNIGRKRTPELIESYLQCLRRDADYPFDLVLLWYRIPAGIVNKIAEANALKRIHLITGVDDLTLAQLYRSAVATLFPSTYEGFGLPVLESMACGTPVVTSFGSSIPEVGGEAAIYLSSMADDAITEALQMLADNRYDLAEFRRRGLEQAKKFRWENCARATVDVYRKYLPR